MYPFLFENRDFLLRLNRVTYRSHVSVKKVAKNASLQKRSPDWLVLQWLATRLCFDGRRRRLSNTMM